LSIFDDYYNVKKYKKKVITNPNMFDEDGKLIPVKDRIKTVTEEKRIKKDPVEAFKKARNTPYCKKGKNFKAKSDFKAVVTEIGHPPHEWLVDYYEYGDLAEKIRFTTRTELNHYLWGVGGEDFIWNNEDYNYNNVFFVRK
jgi:hypothetical protein